MPTISGKVIYNASSSASGAGIGIANIPIVLQDITTNLGVVAKTDSSGNYSIINVPNGNYRIVEAWGTSGGTTPADFSNASNLGVIEPTDPPKSAIPGINPIATNLYSLSPNTILITVSGNVSNMNFIDAPVRNIPIVFYDTMIIGPNILTSADNGTFGVYAAGSAVNSAVNPNPYPELLNGFTYTATLPPHDGYVSITNVTTNNAYGVWWNMASHSIPDERGRYMQINGSNPGATFFKQTVDVSPNSTYLFSTWIANLINRSSGFALPMLGISIKDISGNIIYSVSLNSIAAATIPTWNEVGSIINTGNNTSLTVEFTSQGPAATGNDYAVDDISLRQVSINNIIQTSKSVDKTNADIGDILTYTITITNTGSSVANNIVFIDNLDSKLSFVTGSVTVGGIKVTTANLTSSGISIPSISGGSSTTVTFQVLVLSI
ncbi:MAG: hypothetical protein ACRC92_25470 [Peptostreptococcaceae bacterium]